MGYEVHILAGTQCDWATFIATVKRLGGDSPIRGLDTSWVKVTDFAAFAGCLNLDSGNPIQTLRDLSVTLGHVTMSVMIAWSDKPLVDLTRTTMLRKLEYSVGRGTLVILTGSMLEWHAAMYRCQNPASDGLEREVANKIQVLLDRTGYRELFAEATRRKHSDGTMTLER